MTWRVDPLDHRVVKEIAALPSDLRQSLIRIGAVIEKYGPQEMREPFVKFLGRGLYEMRLRGRDGIARAIYVVAREQRVVVVHVFIKKDQKTPKSAIDLALQRAKEVV